MNITGTIDRPLTNDPKKQAPMKPSTNEPAGSAIEDFTTTGATSSSWEDSFRPRRSSRGPEVSALLAHSGPLGVGVDGPAAPRAKVWLSIPNLKDRADEP